MEAMTLINLNGQLTYILKLYILNLLTFLYVHVML